MTRAITKAVVGAVLCFSLLVPSLANADLSFNRIITFGDSLSDPGNYFVLTGDFVVRPFVPVPDAPYLIGGFHFSNGPTWVEQLATDLRMPASGAPAFLFPGMFTNYAIGRSRAREVPQADLACASCYLAAQVEKFLKDFHGRAPQNALYVVFIGSNDLRDALEVFDLNDLGPSFTIIATAISATQQNIEALLEAGARKFLIANLPNVGITPYVTHFGPPGAVDAAEFLSGWYNAQLEEMLAGFSGSGIQRTTLDVYTLLNKLVDEPSLAHLTNATNSCLAFGVFQGAICAYPKDYLFWDGIHPTTTGHDALSDEAKKELGIAP